MQPPNYALDITQNLGPLQGPLAQASAMAPQQPQQQGGPLAQAGAPPMPQGLPVGPQNAPLNSQMATAAAFKQQEVSKEALAAKKAAVQEAINGGSTASLSKLITAYPDLAAAYKESYAKLDEQEKKTSLLQAGAALSAIKNGEPQTAVVHLRDNAAAMRTGGRTEQADALDQMADQIEAHPESAAFAIGSYGVVNGGKEWAEAIEKVEQGPAALAAKEAAAKKAKAEGDTAYEAEIAKIDLDRGTLGNLRSAIADRAVQQGFDERRVRVLEREAALKAKELELKRGELSEKEAGAVADAVVGAVMAEDAAAEYDGAAKIYEDTASGVGGVLASPFNQGVGLTGKKAVTGALGIATDMDKADQALLRAEMAEARARRPPGSGTYTDADAERDAKAAISLTTTPDAKAARMRELAKKQRKAATIDTVKAEYLNANGTYGPAKKDLHIGGKLIEKGQSFEQAVGSVTSTPAPKKFTAAQAQERIAALRTEGKSNADIAKTMRSEGY